MRLRYFIAPLIIVLGLFFFLNFQESSRLIHEKYELAEWTKVETKNIDMIYGVEAADINKLEIRFDELMGQGQSQIGNQYVLIYQRSASSHSDGSLFCHTSDAGFAIYEDILSPQKYLTLSFTYKPSLKGCSPSIRTAILVDFQEKFNA